MYTIIGDALGVEVRLVHMVCWRQEHPAATTSDPIVNAVLNRLVASYHDARHVFELLASRDSR